MDQPELPDLGEPLSLITESVFARYLSSLKSQRVAASKVLSGPQAQAFTGDKAEFIEKVRRALYLGKIVSYAQGFSQLRAASEENNWDLHYGEIAKIFRAGCIIRAQFLQKITDAYATDANIANLLLDPYFKTSLMNISRRCVMLSLMPSRTVFQRQPSQRQLHTTIAIAQKYCLPT